MKKSKKINQQLNRVIVLMFGLASVFSTLQSQPALHAEYAGNILISKADESNPKGLIRLAAGVNVNAQAIQVQNSINSPYDDIKPRLTPGGNRLYFSRNFHPGNSNGVNDPEDIWYSDFNQSTSTWSEPIHMTGVLNNAGPNYINNVSVTGDTIILGNQYLKKGRMRAGLSYSVTANGTWSEPKTINIVNDYNLSGHANSFVSLRNGVIIQAVQRAESLGGRDLFVSFWDGTKATEPISMGTVINTEAEESSPFLTADNKTMYFASKGHKGYGGYDIFVTHRLDETWTNWSTPENLGPAVNGDLDDEFFSISHCGKYAVFSKQLTVHNNDLFRISMSELFEGKIPVNNRDQKVVTERPTSFASL